MYREPLKVLRRLCAQYQVPATLFVVASDIVGPAVSALREARQSGFEIACHSHSHAWNLAHQSEQEIREDIHRAVDAIAQHVGVIPQGYRAPLDLSDSMLAAISNAGFLYDASLVPGALGTLHQLRAQWRTQGLHRTSLPPRFPHAGPHRAGTLTELPTSSAFGVPLLSGAIGRLPVSVNERLAVRASRDAWVCLRLQMLFFAEARHMPRALQTTPLLRVPLEQRLERLAPWLKLAARRESLTCTAAVQRFREHRS